MSIATRSSASSIGEWGLYYFFHFSFLTDILVEDIFFTQPDKFRSSYAFAFLIPSLHSWASFFLECLHFWNVYILPGMRVLTSTAYARPSCVSV